MAQVPDASTVPVPDVSPEEEALLFGSQGQPTAPAGGANPFASPPATPAQAHASPAGSQVGGVQAGNGLGEGNFQAIFMEMLRQQSQANQQNQQLIAALMRRMDLEEKRRNEAEEKAAETARLVAEAAARAKTEDPFAAAPSTPSVPFAGATSSSSSVRSPLVQNRAEKYLPSLPMLEHQGMNKGRMREVETWHAYLETLSSWLALQDESFVRELQLCVKQKNEILQKDLADDVAARSVYSACGLRACGDHSRSNYSIRVFRMESCLRAGSSGIKLGDITMKASKDGRQDRNPFHLDGTSGNEVFSCRGSQAWELVQSLRPNGRLTDGVFAASL
ncbi:unnamed protein product [Symbiodinium natans]|uniref:Uncharacterized protein n=1 Tax=Symbiodinium natans TaxID=878477 RepID=A0A812S505_9DINO|nr:unnamed protein product [Symbiodinium natans]